MRMRKAHSMHAYKDTCSAVFNTKSLTTRCRASKEKTRFLCRHTRRIKPLYFCAVHQEGKEDAAKAYMLVCPRRKIRGSV